MRAYIYIYGCGRLIEFGTVIGWANSVLGRARPWTNPVWKSMDFKHPFGFQQSLNRAICPPQGNLPTAVTVHKMQCLCGKMEIPARMGYPPGFRGSDTMSSRWAHDPQKN